MKETSGGILPRLRVILFFCFYFLSIFTASAGGNDVSEGETLNVEIDAPVPATCALDWFKHPSVMQSGLQLFVWEPLFKTDRLTGQLMPWLADKYLFEGFAGNGSPQVLIWLRPNITWADGTPLWATDVAQTITHALGQPVGENQFLGLLQHSISGARAVSAQQLTLTLRKPDWRVLHRLFATGPMGSFPILKQAADSDSDCAFTMGSGAFEIETADVTPQVLVPNENWWIAAQGIEDRPAISEVQLRPKVDMRTRVAQIVKTDASRIDLGLPFSPVVFADIEGSVNAWQNEPPSGFDALCVRSLDFNLNDNVWSSIELRKAVNAVIDRSDVAKYAYDGGALPARSPFPLRPALAPVLAALDEEGVVFSPKANLAKAEALLTAAGYTKNETSGFWTEGGSSLKLTILVRESPAEFGRAAMDLAQQLRRFGIDAKVMRQSPTDYAGTIAGKTEWTATYGVMGCGSDTDPLASLLRYSARTDPSAQGIVPHQNNVNNWAGYNARMFSVLAGIVERRPPGDYAIPRLTRITLNFAYKDLPFIPVVQPTVILPNNMKVWKGWPTVEGMRNPVAQWHHSGIGFTSHLSVEN